MCLKEEKEEKKTLKKLTRKVANATFSEEIRVCIEEFIVRGNKNKESNQSVRVELDAKDKRDKNNSKSTAATSSNNEAKDA